REDELAAIKGRKCQPGAFLAPSLDSPSTSVANDFHLASLPPPTIHLAGKGNPHLPLLTHLSEMLHESLIGRSGPFLDDVVRMNEKAGQAVLLCDGGDLPLPQLDRVVVQDVEQGIILDRRERKLEDPPDEERHQAATAASLSIQMRYTRDGHVVGKLQGALPSRGSIERAGTE